MDFNFINLLNSFGIRHKSIPGGYKVRCLNSAGHRRGDKNPSLRLTEASEAYEASYHCQVCEIHGNRWDFTGLLMGLTGYVGNEAAIRDKLIELGLIKPDPTKRKNIGVNPLNVPPKRLCYYPELLEVTAPDKNGRPRRLFQLNDSILLATVQWWIEYNAKRGRGKGFWNCSLKKLRENHLPFFTEVTLYRSVQFLQSQEANSVMTAFTNHRTTRWYIDRHILKQFLTQGKSKKSIHAGPEEVGFQNERTEGKAASAVLEVGRDFFKSFGSRLKPSDSPSFPITSANYAANISRIMRAAKR